MTIQSFPQFPLIPPALFGVSGVAYSTADADGEGIAPQIQVPITGTLTDIAFAVATVTTGDAAFSVRVETIDGATGLPSGTLIDSPTNAAYGAVNIADTDDNKIISCQINSGTGVAVTRGDHIAIKLTRPTSGSFNGRIIYGGAYQSSVASNYPNVAVNTGSWVKGCNLPVCAMKISGTWYLPNMCILYASISNTAINDPGTPKQLGILVNKPVGLRLAGALVMVAAGSAEDYQLKLYSDPTGAPSLVATSNNFDADFRESINVRWTSHIFNSSPELTKDTAYVLCINPTTANEINVYYQEMGSTTYNACLPMGSNATYYYRSDTGPFAETNTRVPFIIPIFDGIDIGSGGGGIFMPRARQIGV